VRVLQLVGMYETGVLLLCVQQLKKQKTPAVIAEGLEHGAKAVAVRARLARENADATVFLVELAAAERLLGHLHAIRNDADAAYKSYRDAADHLETWKASDTRNDLHQIGIARTYFFLGRECVKLGKHAEACGWLTKCVEAPGQHSRTLLLETAAELESCAAKLEDPAVRARCVALRQDCLAKAERLNAK
jgi:hypothetical protein